MMRAAIGAAGNTEWNLAQRLSRCKDPIRTTKPEESGRAEKDGRSPTIAFLRGRPINSN
jgi:hypothetical protein